MIVVHRWGNPLTPLNQTNLAGWLAHFENRSYQPADLWPSLDCSEAVYHIDLDPWQEDETTGSQYEQEPGNLVGYTFVYPVVEPEAGYDPSEPFYAPSGSDIPADMDTETRSVRYVDTTVVSGKFLCPV